MKAEVVPGQVSVSSVYCILRRENFAVLEIECDHKYIEVGSYSSGYGLSLYCTARTPQPYKPDADGTWVRLPEEFAGWRMVTEWARYTVTVVLYRQDDRDEHTRLWPEEDENGEAEQGDRPGGGEQPAADEGDGP